MRRTAPIYGTTSAETLEKLEVLRVTTEKGHLEEFYNEECTFYYYVLDGEGTFYLDGEAIPVEPYDLVTTPPHTKIYYLGNMELLLVATPPWSPEQEVHVRYLNEDGETVEQDEHS